jgi:hypothetical protein
LNSVGIFKCQKVKKGDLVEFVYNCKSIEDEEYNYRAKGKVFSVEEGEVLVELPKNFKIIGDIKGWSGVSEIDMGCKPNRMYWWIKTYRVIKVMEIE